MSVRRLGGYGVFAAMLFCAGLPIYIHAPKVYADDYGVGLGALGAVLFGLRLVDVVQDPALGWLARRLGRWRPLAVTAGGALMALAMLGLFAVPPPVAPLAWFAAMLTALFTGFSFLTIVFYAQGVRTAVALGPGGHVRLAAWRESGGLLGVCAAAVAPTVLAGMGLPAFPAFAAWFAVLAMLALLLMRGEWIAAPVAADQGGWRQVLGDPVARRLLAIALVNAAPVAVTSTLFLFFVESRLGAPGLAGPLLVLFFLSAAAAAPVWARIAAQIGRRRALLAGMALSVAAFAFAAGLREGDTLAFAAICLVSGAALGADMTLLPALFAARMERIAPEAAQAFGLWSFVSKLALALAAVALLPMLQAAGFQGGTDSPPAALGLLSTLYALVPCVLKIVAIVLLTMTRIGED